MKKNYKLIPCVVCALLVVACNSKSAHNNDDRFIKVNTVCFSHEVKEIISNYMRKNEQYHCFTMLTDCEYNWNNGYKKKPTLYIIGPTVAGLFCNGEGTLSYYPMQYIEISDHYIFVQSSIDELSNIDSISYNNFLRSNNIHLPIKQHPLNTFLSDALAFETNEGKVIVISNRVDTLILKEKINFIPSTGKLEDSKYR